LRCFGKESTPPVLGMVKGLEVSASRFIISTRRQAP
jgi:hypothetical protein